MAKQKAEKKGAAVEIIIAEIRTAIGMLPDPEYPTTYNRALDEIKNVLVDSLRVAMIRDPDDAKLAEYQSVLRMLHELSGLDYKRARNIIESMK